MLKTFDFEKMPIVEIVNEILVDSSKKGASDIHFDPHPEVMRIRTRIDGELKNYADDVFIRFENPFIKHLCASISLNSVSKFKVRVLPSILEYIKRKGSTPKNLLLSFAKLIEFYKTDMPNDDEKIIEFMKSEDVDTILANAELWGQDLSFLANALKKVMK